MVICGQEFKEEIIKQIQTTIEMEPEISRRKLSMKVCQWLNWRAPNGKYKDMSCRVALVKLQRMGLIELPETGTNGFHRGQRKCDEQCGQEAFLGECQLEELGEVELVAIESGERKTSQIWNGLMSRYHYLGAGQLCGAQIRYLIKSSTQGWLGGVSFSGAAWRVGARDNWIGWSEQARRENLNKVVCNSRFLIVPKVANLASHVLSLCVKRIGGDWVERYGFSPLLLETYVERDRFEGTCYRAANWVYVGTSKGRGRQDRDRRYGVAIKDVYLYPLHEKASIILGEESKKSMPERGPQKPEGEDWAEEEFGLVELGDHRLTQRLMGIARDFYARPQASIPQACQTRAKTKGAYRFFDHPETNMDKVLEQHYEATVFRSSTESVVLAVQDTTSLNYSTHPATENLGPIGSSQESIIGLLVHDTMAFNLEGTPVGLLDVQCWARDKEEFGKKKRRHELPIEQKESYKWLRSWQRVAQWQKRCPKTTFVSVGDREADIYELFEMTLSEPSGPKLLVRAIQNRRLTEDEGHLWDRVGQQQVSGIQEVMVPRRGTRPARIAKLEVRFAKVKLKPPKRKAELRDITLWAVLAQEVDGPAESEALEWMLLTTCEIADFAQAVEKLSWYTLRWGIEVYHRTLKSGCKIEQRQLGHADRIEACLAIDMVVAWRIFHLVKLGRETPEVPCTVFFEEAEWKALSVYISQNPKPPDSPPTLREATRMVASLGGFLGRKGDGEPGTKTLWLGLQRLDDISSMWKILSVVHTTHIPNPPVSSKPNYG